MRTSSARLEIAETESIPETRQAGFLTSPSGQPSMGGATVTTFTPLSAPSLNTFGSEYAPSFRRLERLNTTRTVNQQELDRLLRERQALLDKKFDGTMNRKDEIRLEYVRWSLDRIHDAKSGPTLDALENIVDRYERFMSEMRIFERQLIDAVEANKRKR